MRSRRIITVSNTELAALGRDARSGCGELSIAQNGSSARGNSRERLGVPSRTLAEAHQLSAAPGRDTLVELVRVSLDRGPGRREPRALAEAQYLRRPAALTSY